MVKLLGRACRNKSYWIPEQPPHSDRVHRFVAQERWPDVLTLLKEHELILEKKLPSSERGSIFHHIKRSKDLLREDATDPTIRRLYESLVKKIWEDRSGA